MTGPMANLKDAAVRQMSNLTCYLIDDNHPVNIRPAPTERAWMDGTPQRFAYRCLPMNIANAYGWEILSNETFTAIWDGTANKAAIRIEPGGYAVSHFGSGILTIHTPCIFRTDPGVDLYVTGPVNRPKDAIAPLTGVVETDWAPYTFTMNWMFTRPHTPVRFEKDEPLCHLFPVARGGVENVVPVSARLSDAPELEAHYKAWCESRNTFNSALETPGSTASAQRWQKTYFRGQKPDGEAAGSEGHRSKLTLKPFPPLEI